MRRFPVIRIPEPGATIRLDAATSHHLLEVCRHRRGGRLVVFDGSGQQAGAELIGVVDGHAAVRIDGVAVRAAPPHPLHLVLGIPKGPSLDNALRMAVEAGATHIHPAIAARSVKRSDRADRWERILEGAVQQCGRADLPVLSPLLPLSRAVRAVPDALDRRIAVPGADRGEPAIGGAAVAIGPEGGWTAHEVDRMLAEGWQPMGLGAWVLRSDTAVAVGLALTAPT